MECKQWLYNHGDECPWNTGGWIFCKVEQSVSNFKYSSLSTNAIAEAKVQLLDSHISYVCNCSSSAIHLGGIDYVRGGATAIANVGTVKQVNLAKNVRQLNITGNDVVTACFRIGETNSETTQVNTATVLQSGTANGLITSITENGYLVLGSVSIIPQIGSSSSYGHDGMSYSYNSDGDITEIYLI